LYFSKYKTPRGTMAREIDEKGLAQRQAAARKHGIYAFRDRGEDSLTVENIKSLHDLRELVKSQPGREELRKELTARVATICWMGFGELQKAGQAGHLWTSPVVKRAATWVAELRRLLDSFPDDSDVIDAEMVLETLEKEKKNDNKNERTD
jgi:hypothetical protein